MILRKNRRTRGHRKQKKQDKSFHSSLKLKRTGIPTLSAPMRSYTNNITYIQRFTSSRSIIILSCSCLDNNHAISTSHTIHARILDHLDGLNLMDTDRRKALHLRAIDHNHSLRRGVY